MDRFLYINKSVIDRDLLLYYVNRAGCGEVKGDFIIERNNLYPYCVIHYVVNGSGYVVCKGKEYSISQGDLFILNAYESHRYFTNKNNLLQLEWVEFIGSDSVKLITAILKRSENVIKAPFSERIREALHELFKIIKDNDKDSRFLISKIIYFMLMELLSISTFNGGNDLPNLSQSNISKVIYFIDNNLDKRINTEILAGICCYSPTYFAKLFYKVTGNTPMNFVLEMRINKAKELLSESSASVEHLSQLLGFSSPSHFIRNFKKVEGITPSEYRKQSLMFRS